MRGGLANGRRPSGRRLREPAGVAAGRPALEDLRWYLEDYLRAPFGVWEDRGPAIRDRLAGWGDAVFASVFGTPAGREAYDRAQAQRLELVFRSGDAGMLGLPWELMRDGAGPGGAEPGRDLPEPAGCGRRASRWRCRAGGCGC